MMQKPRNDDAGHYLVTTATGSHCARSDSQNGEAAFGASVSVVDYLDAGFSQVPRDGETLELLMLESCAVGASGRCWIQVRHDHIPTSE